MFATVAKCTSILALLVELSLPTTTGGYQLPLAFMICIGAIVVVQQAIHEKKYGWAAAFIAVALSFNPVIMMPKPPALVFAALVGGSAIAFAASLALLKTHPPLSILSITNRGPQGESL